MSKLWRGHGATPTQQKLPFARCRNRRKAVTQADVLIGLLRKAHSEKRALALPEIMHAGIAQFTARIFELRERGFKIENELQRSSDGRVLSRYWLRHDPEKGGAQ